jgi:hypothetical protein
MPEIGNALVEREEKQRSSRRRYGEVSLLPVLLRDGAALSFAGRF